MTKGKTIQKNSGSTLAWVTITMVVLLIIVGGILSLASIYHQRSVNNNAKSQSYYTARSGINAVVARLTQEPAGAFAQRLGAMKSKDVLELNTVKFGPSVSIGTCKLAVHKVGSSLYLKAEGAQGGMESTVVAELGTRKEKNNPLPFWSDFVYGANFDCDNSGNKEFNNITITAEPDKSKGSMFVGDLSENPDEGPNRETFSLRTTGQGENIITGNVYSKRPLELVAANNDKKGKIVIGGKVVTDQSLEAVGAYFIGRGITSSSIVTLNSSGTIGDGNTKSGGDIIAETLTVSGDVKIYGNITAKTVTLSGNPEITGEIKADEIILTLDKNDPPQISGNVIANMLSLKFDGISLADYNRVIFTKDVKLQILKIDGTVENDIKGTIGKLVSPGKLTSGNVPMLKDPSPLVFPSISSPAGVPNIESIQSLENFEEIVINSSHESMDLGKEGSDDSYYLVTSATNAFSITSLKGEGKIFLYLKAGVELNLESMPNVMNSKAKLFIIAEPDSTLEVNAKNFHGYIWGKKGSEISIVGSSNETQTIRGGLFCEGELEIDKGVEIIYEELSDGISGGGGDPGTEKTIWYLKQYYNDVPLPKAGE